VGNHRLSSLGTQRAVPRGITTSREVPRDALRDTVKASVEGASDGSDGKPIAAAIATGRSTRREKMLDGRDRPMISRSRGVDLPPGAAATAGARCLIAWPDGKLDGKRVAVCHRWIPSHEARNR
jgi:hypothetical protein